MNKVWKWILIFLGALVVVFLIDPGILWTVRIPSCGCPGWLPEGLRHDGLGNDGISSSGNAAWVGSAGIRHLWHRRPRLWQAPDPASPHAQDLPELRQGGGEGLGELSLLRA